MSVVGTGAVYRRSVFVAIAVTAAVAAATAVVAGFTRWTSKSADGKGDRSDEEEVYVPPRELQDFVLGLPVVRRVLDDVKMSDAPFHPLLAGKAKEDKEDKEDADDDKNIKETERFKENEMSLPARAVMLEAVEGTLLRGRLLFRRGGIEYGVGGLHRDSAMPTLVMFIRVGADVCGHKEITHGGMIAGLFDDSMGYLFFAEAAGRYSGFTANLNVNYREKLPAGRTIAVVVRRDRIEGRKVFLKAEIWDAECPYVPVSPEDSKGSPRDPKDPKMRTDRLLLGREWVGGASTLYAQADALFVIPRSE